jgi:hypothetical protein
MDTWREREVVLPATVLGLIQGFGVHEKMLRNSRVLARQRSSFAQPSANR